MKIEIFKSPKDGQWYGHLVARNGNILAQSEGYQRSNGARKWASALKRAAAAPVSTVKR